MDIADKNLWLLFEWGGDRYYVTQSLLATWAVMVVLIVFAVIVRIRLRSFRSVPRKFQNTVEAMVEMMSNFSKSTMGDNMDGYGGYFFGVFAFILASNYIGLLGFRPPTANLSTAVALALSTFLLVHVSGIRSQKGRYFKDYFSPNPIFFPINVIGELSKPISLAFRLFGNLLSGVIIMALVYEMMPFALRFLLPGVLHIYFDVLVGALQAFVFTVLSMSFLAQKAT